MQLDGVVEVGEQQRVDDEARAVAAGDRDLLDRGGQRQHGLVDLGGGEVGRDHLDELHDRRGVEEVHADDVAGALGDLGELGDRHRAGGRGQDGPGLGDPVEVLEELGLDVEVLGDALDDQVGLGEVLARGAAGEAAEHRGLGLLVRTALGDGLVERLGDAGDDPVELLLRAADEDDVVARLSEDLDDARGHRSGADHADLLDRAAQLGSLDVIPGHRSEGAGLAGDLGEQVGRLVQVVAGLLEAGEQRVAYGGCADLVDRGERSLGVAAAETHGVVDVGGGGVARLEHANGVVEVGQYEHVVNGTLGRNRHATEDCQIYYP